MLVKTMLQKLHTYLELKRLELASFGKQINTFGAAPAVLAHLLSVGAASQTLPPVAIPQHILVSSPPPHEALVVQATPAFLS